MARRRSNQAKWMRDPRIVRWDIAQITYETTDMPEKYYKGFQWTDAIITPRHRAEEKRRQLKHEQTPRGVHEQYLKRVRGLLKGD